MNWDAYKVRFHYFSGFFFFFFGKVVRTKIPLGIWWSLWTLSKDKSTYIQTHELLHVIPVPYISAVTCPWSPLKNTSAADCSRCCFWFLPFPNRCTRCCPCAVGISVSCQLLCTQFIFHSTVVRSRFRMTNQPARTSFLHTGSCVGIQFSFFHDPYRYLLLSWKETLSYSKRKRKTFQME